MASPVVTPPAYDASAQITALGAALAGVEPAPPAPAPEVAPVAPGNAGVTDPVAPPEQLASPAPVPDQPGTAGSTPQEPQALSLENLSPEAKRALEMAGGSVDKALAKHISDNNRLAEIGKAAKAGDWTRVAALVGQESAPVAGVAPVPVVEPPKAPEPPAVTLNPAEIEQYVAQQLPDVLGRDQVRSALITQFNTEIQPQLAAAAAAVPRLEQEIQIARMRLEIPEIAADAYRSSELRTEIREKSSDLRNAKEDKRYFENEKVRLDREFRARESELADAVRNHITTQKTAEQRRLSQAQSVEHAAQELQSAWEPTLAAACRTHNIPDQLVESFKERMKDRALASLESGKALNVAALPQFIGEGAAKFMTDLDTAHRVKSGVYATQAAQRAAQPAPPPVRPSSDPNRKPPSDRLEAVTMQSRDNLAHLLRGGV